MGNSASAPFLELSILRHHPFAIQIQLVQLIPRCLEAIWLIPAAHSITLETLHPWKSITRRRPDEFHRFCRDKPKNVKVLEVRRHAQGLAPCDFSTHMTSVALVGLLIEPPLRGWGAITSCRA